ncbi:MULTISPECIES: capsular polysaccharide synthesis protein [Falsihalocynthiibacter]|uniref:capsular polysaccharide synthesis protein n=1 Tax=Falsihalocynthiibacter TaxID=2854182 RepID=UPI003001DABD
MLRNTFIRVKRTRLGPLITPPPLEGLNSADLPKNIYFFWDRGLENAPDLVRACHASWTEKNPDWNFVFLDQEKANRILDRSSLPEGTLPAHYADILRTKLLCERGGVWADATSFCNHPLTNWMPTVMSQADFFAFRTPRPARIVSNWFLASKPQGKIIRPWLDVTEKFWAGRKEAPKTYYWHDFSFEWLTYTSQSFRKEWSKVPNFSATPTHRILKLHFENQEPTETDKNVIRGAFVHKLTWKENFRENFLNEHLDL